MAIATPDPNNLSLLNFRLTFTKIPHVVYRVQTMSLPGIQLGVASVPTPMIPIRRPGNITYDEVNLTFLVGENMQDYLEIQNWMKELGQVDFVGSSERVLSDASVLIMNSAFRPNLEARFTEVFPTSLSSIEFDSTLQDVQYATATVSLAFTRYDITPL